MIEHFIVPGLGNGAAGGRIRILILMVLVLILMHGGLQHLQAIQGVIIIVIMQLKLFTEFTSYWLIRQLPPNPGSVWGKELLWNSKMWDPLDSFDPCSSPSPSASDPRPLSCKKRPSVKFPPRTKKTTTYCSSYVRCGSACLILVCSLRGWWGPRFKALAIFRAALNTTKLKRRSKNRHVATTFLRVIFDSTRAAFPPDSGHSNGA